MDVRPSGTVGGEPSLDQRRQFSELHTSSGSGVPNLRIPGHGQFPDAKWSGVLSGGHPDKK
jgi:hypothetical protein